MKILAKVIFFDSEEKIQPEDKLTKLSGSLKRQTEEDKLMHSVVEAKEKKEKGKLLQEAINQGMRAFTPEMMFEQLVTNYSLAKQLYGETIFRLLSGYDPKYIQRNKNIPEFQVELKNRMSKTVEDLREEGYLDQNNMMTDKAFEIASFSLYVEELEKFKAKGVFGEKWQKKKSHYGDKEDIVDYQKGSRYRDLALRRSINVALKRGHATIHPQDLKLFERQSKGHIDIIYALDASGSMRGKKISMCKRAGVALAFNAIEKKDKVGLMVFGSDIKKIVEPTDDFLMLLKEITGIIATKQTNLTETLKKAIELFRSRDASKHLVLITDAMPTIGNNPSKDALEAVSLIRDAGITLSIVGIMLTKEAEQLAKQMVEISQGKLLICRELENLDALILEDYYAVI